MALVERQLAYDYVYNPVKNIKSLQHRVDQAAEKWLISMTKEQAPQSEPLRDLFGAKNLTFVESSPAVEIDSVLSDILAQTNESDAISTTLKKLAQLTGKEFVFLKNDITGETLGLCDVSFGLSASHKGLGIRYADVPRAQNFFTKPSEHPLWIEFFQNIFKTSETNVYALKSSDQILGFLVSLSPLQGQSVTVRDCCAQVLTLMVDNFQKSRWVYDYLQLDKCTDCYTNKAFYEKMALEVSRSRRLNLPVSVLTFEITCKNELFNQRSAQLVAKILKRFTRSTDVVGRVAETRFALVFPHTALTPAAKKAGILLGIIKAALEEKQWLEVYVSAGVNEFPEQCTDSLSLLQGSEEACDQAAPFEVMANQKHSDKQHDANF
jgi:GGDEF domain-containing protein